MSVRRKTTKTHSKSFLMQIAQLGLRRALRPFLRHTSPSFVAALVLPPGATPHIYVDAATELFTPNLGDYEISDDFSVAYLDASEEKELARKFAMATVLRRTLFLLTSDCDLPTDFMLALDHYCVMPLPSARHFIVTSKKLGLGEIDASDADFLASLSFAQLRSAMTVGRSMATVVRRLRSVKDEPPRVEAEAIHSKPGLSLDDIVGFSDVKSWARDLAKDVAEWRAGHLPWADVDRGAVFAGPPGTGKTKLAAAVAGACGFHFISTSMARWQAKGHLGDFLAAMRADFNAAAENAPCILHLEELDSIGDRAADSSDNSQYTRKSVNGFLEAVDEAFAKEGVVILGSTNDVSAIDEAVLRSGRIERIFRVGLPTPEERLSILALHLRPHEVQLPVPHVRLVSSGMSGADMEKVARDAKRRARAEGRAVVSDDVLRFLPSTRPFSDAERQRVAVHEGGHAIVGIKLLPHKLVGVSVNDVFVMGRSMQSMGTTSFERAQTTQRSALDYRNEIAMLLGGIAAEELVFGNYSDGAGGLPGSDLAIATDLATRMETHLGFGETLVSEVGDDAAFLRQVRMTRPEILSRVDAVLRGEYRQAEEIISGNRRALDDLVEALLENKVLPGEVVVEIVETADYRRRPGRNTPKRARRG